MANRKKPEEPAVKAEETLETPGTEEQDLPEAPATESAGESDEAAAQPEDGQESYTLTAEEFAAARAHIEKLQKERDDTVLLLQRNQADFDNYRRRNASIRADSLAEGKRDCIKALLPVLDNFDRAMAAESTDAAWREGVALVYRQLYDALAKQGMTEIEAEGAFDPALHEAVMQEKAEDAESGTITAVLQKGYRVDDRIVRHSMVKVAE